MTSTQISLNVVKGNKILRHDARIVTQDEQLMKKVISTSKAPAAVGPYSQAIFSNPFIFTSGQIPLDPATGELVSGGIEAETVRAIENLQAVLEAAGASLSQVVKTTVFLLDMKDFTAMNQVYARYFPIEPPARSTVQAVLPKGARVEIEAIARIEPS